LSSGQTRTVTHACEVTLAAYEMVLPSETELGRLIAPGEPPKKHRLDITPTARSTRRAT